MRSRSSSTAERQPAQQPYPVHWIPGRCRRGSRTSAARSNRARRAAGRRRLRDRNVRANRARVRGRTAPFVLKLTGDPAFERARAAGASAATSRRSSTGAAGSTSASPARRATHAPLGRARRCARATILRDLAISWGVAPDAVSVLPNAIPPLPPLAPGSELRASFGMRRADARVRRPARRRRRRSTSRSARSSASAASRFSSQATGRSAAERACRAVRLLGPLPRERVLELFAAADAAVLSSSWENFPHSLVEALAVVRR